MNSENRGLNDRVVIFDDGHVGVKETDDISVDDLKNIQEGFKAIGSRAGKVLADV